MVNNKVLRNLLGFLLVQWSGYACREAGVICVYLEDFEDLPNRQYQRTRQRTQYPDVYPSPTYCPQTGSPTYCVQSVVIGGRDEADRKNMSSAPEYDHEEEYSRAALANRMSSLPNSGIDNYTPNRPEELLPLVPDPITPKLSRDPKDYLAKYEIYFQKVLELLKDKLEATEIPRRRTTLGEEVPLDRIPRTRRRKVRRYRLTPVEEDYDTYDEEEYPVEEPTYVLKRRKRFTPYIKRLSKNIFREDPRVNTLQTSNLYE